MNNKLHGLYIKAKRSDNLVQRRWLFIERQGEGVEKSKYRNKLKILSPLCVSFHLESLPLLPPHPTVPAAFFKSPDSPQLHSASFCQAIKQQVLWG